MTTKPIRVLLADDHALVRQGFRRILEDEPDIVVAGEASGGAQAIDLARSLVPDVIVMDLAMPEINGLHAAIEILRHRPESRVLILTMHADEQYVRNALDAGVKGYILKNALETDLTRAVRVLASGGQFLSPELSELAIRRLRRDDDRAAEDPFSSLSAREIQVLRLIALGKSNKEIASILGLSANTVSVHRTNVMNTLGVHKTAELVLLAVKKGLIVGFLLAALVAAGSPQTPPTAGFELTDVTAPAGLHFTHYTGAAGRKYLPETLGAGAAFVDIDNDGWQDVILANGTDWPGSAARGKTTARVFRNTGRGGFEDVTAGSGLDVPMYGMGVAAADYDNDGREDVLITAVGQSRLFHNVGSGRFVDVTDRAGLGGRTGFSTSAVWIDYDRDGLVDLFICNYVRWTPETDVFCSADGTRKSYCTPEAYPGATSWLFRNKGNGTFEDVTATAGLLDPTSKALGVTMLDYDRDGWPDLFVANDTQPNKLYRNTGAGRFVETAVGAGLAFSEDGRARAGMGTDAADLDNSGIPSVVVTNFSGEMLGLYTPTTAGHYEDRAAHSEVGTATRLTLGFGCFFFDADLDGLLDLLVVNGHIDEGVRAAGGRVEYAEAPHLFHNAGGRLVDVARQAGADFAAPKVGRGAAFADIDLDGDLDVLVTTNGGPARLYRNRVTLPNRAIRIALRGTKSNHDGIGAIVRARVAGSWLTRLVRTGSSYLSQSELPLTFGLGTRAEADEVVIEWPSGRREKTDALAAGRFYTITEGRGVTSSQPLGRP